MWTDAELHKVAQIEATVRVNCVENVWLKENLQLCQVLLFLLMSVQKQGQKWEGLGGKFLVSLKSACLTHSRWLLSQQIYCQSGNPSIGSLFLKHTECKNASNKTKVTAGDIWTHLGNASPWTLKIYLNAAGKISLFCSFLHPQIPCLETSWYYLVVVDFVGSQCVSSIFAPWNIVP